MNNSIIDDLIITYRNGQTEDRELMLSILENQSLDDQLRFLKIISLDKNIELDDEFYMTLWECKAPFDHIKNIFLHIISAPSTKNMTFISAGVKFYKVPSQEEVIKQYKTKK